MVEGTVSQIFDKGHGSILFYLKSGSCLLSLLI